MSGNARHPTLDNIFGCIRYNEKCPGALVFHTADELIMLWLRNAKCFFKVNLLNRNSVYTLVLTMINKKTRTLRDGRRLGRWRSSRLCVHGWCCNESNQRPSQHVGYHHVAS